ncbi:response regulator [Massilia sp. B-10]|nr:response regulator [Massilia sp. B-10]
MIEGLRQAALAPYDVALVDIGLPRMDGYEVARRLRADPATRGMRLIALTGYGQENDRAMALDASLRRAPGQAGRDAPADRGTRRNGARPGLARPRAATPAACAGGCRPGAGFRRSRPA